MIFPLVAYLISFPVPLLALFSSIWLPLISKKSCFIFYMEGDGNGAGDKRTNIHYYKRKIRTGKPRKSRGMFILEYLFSTLSVHENLLGSFKKY